MQMREFASKQYLLGVICLAAVLLPPVLQTVRGQSSGPPFSDPTNDLFDKNGNPITAEPYLDIVSVDIWKSSGNYTIELVVNGPLPKSIDPSLWIDWDILVDTDNNASTGWYWPLVLNDIGADLIVRLGMANSTFYPDAFPYVLNAASVSGLNVLVEGNRIVFTLSPPLMLKLPPTFSWTVAARKYGNRGLPPNPPLLAADKAPNTGHYVTDLETVRTETNASQVSTTEASQTGGPPAAMVNPIEAIPGGITTIVGVVLLGVVIAAIAVVHGRRKP